jgi:hypothetical protein
MELLSFGGIMLPDFSIFLVFLHWDLHIWDKIIDWKFESTTIFWLKYSQCWTGQYSGLFKVLFLTTWLGIWLSRWPFTHMPKALGLMLNTAQIRKTSWNLVKDHLSASTIYASLVWELYSLCAWKVSTCSIVLQFGSLGAVSVQPLELPECIREWEEK